MATLDDDTFNFIITYFIVTVASFQFNIVFMLYNEQLPAQI